MSPYRTPPAESKPHEGVVASPPYLVLGFLLLAALRVVVAIATKEHCGADVGIATVVLALCARALFPR